MKTRKIAIVASMLIGFSMPPMAFAQAANVASFLNMANQMNNGEVKTPRSCAARRETIKP